MRIYFCCPPIFICLA